MVAVNQRPFSPVPGGTVNISVTASSQPIRLQTVNDASGVVRIYNAGTATVWVEFGGSTVTASTTTSMPIPAGGVYVIGNTQQYIAAIALAATGTIYFTPGDGVS